MQKTESKLEKIVKSLNLLPGNKKKIWLEIEKFLLEKKPEWSREDRVIIISGIILNNIPEMKKNDYLIEIKNLAEASLEYFETIFKGDLDAFNDYRLYLRSGIFGSLND